MGKHGIARSSWYHQFTQGTVRSYCAFVISMLLIMVLPHL